MMAPRIYPGGAKQAVDPCEGVDNNFRSARDRRTGNPVTFDFFPGDGHDVISRSLFERPAAQEDALGVIALANAFCCYFDNVRIRL